ncbi:MAG TPA: type II toxin-antitoxin system VapC family toxin [Terriglobales bacterium]|nr:type II toxin-antitoxin system VapC family toxin [Terriglobales bacterium]
MIVLDASAAVDWLLQTPAGRRIDDRIYSNNAALHAPHLLDLEVAQVLRRLAHQGAVPSQRADEAFRDLQDLRIHRYPHFVLLPRIWELRHNFSAYDAAYIVLAETLGAALLTRDRRLASTVYHAATVEVF